MLNVKLSEESSLEEGKIVNEAFGTPVKAKEKEESTDDSIPDYIEDIQNVIQQHKRKESGFKEVKPNKTLLTAFTKQFEQIT